jgi:hypothetical protein
MNHAQIEALKDTAARVDALEIVIRAIIFDAERTNPGNTERVRNSVINFLTTEGAGRTRVGRQLRAMLNEPGIFSE